MPTGAGWRGFTPAQAAALSLTLWISAFALVLAFAHATWKSAQEVGVIAAALSGAMGLLLQRVVSGRSLNVVLTGRVAAMLFRLGLLAGAMVYTIKSMQGDPLGFVVTFFPLFFLSTAIEHFTTAVPGRPAGAAR
jgi:hypothetical protein